MNKQISIRTLIFWAAIIGFVLFFIDSCKRNFRGGFLGSKTDTLSVRSDTVWAITESDTVYVPKPFTITNTRTNTVYKPFYRTDTLEISEVLPTDTAAILARFYQKAFYQDTVSKKDTTLRKYGFVIVADSIHQNRITSRRVITSLKIPEVTNTITLVKSKPVVYMGATVMGTPASPVYAIGGDLSLKSVNGKMYSIGAMSTKQGAMYYTGSLRVPIRLRKNR